uniref:Uncharacterized protein n=1 Tax=Zooxanthella nutricula TaxID=1333877 RepID=A0A7S2KB35_9DINO
MDGYPDFQIVDLAKRHKLSGSVDALFEDKYLFKAYPLLYRTWLLHSYLAAQQVLGGKDENGMMRHVFAQSCIDVPLGGGRASSLPYFVPLALGSGLTGNLILVLVTLAVLTVLLFVAKVCNTPAAYQLARLWTLPLRLGYLAFVFYALNLSTFASALGYSITILALLGDFVTGDIAALWWYRLQCTYTISKNLPGRLLVCSREGAVQWEDFFGSRGCVDQCVSGFGSWERHHHLVVDIGDMLIELRPLQHDDVLKLRDQFFYNGKDIPYLGLDIFDIDDMASTAASTSSFPRVNMSLPATDMHLEEF